MPTYYKKPNFNSCVLCLKSTKKGYDISLHKFPKNPARRAVWLKNCGFVEEDVQHNRKLCSSHFEKNCIILTGIRRVLKKSAIPVIFKETITMKKNKKQSQYSQTVSETDTTLKTQVDDPENPAADVIPMAVLCQFTAKLSEYSLDPEKSYGTNNVPIIPVNY